MTGIILLSSFLRRYDSVEISAITLDLAGDTEKVETRVSHQTQLHRYMRMSSLRYLITGLIKLVSRNIQNLSHKVEEIKFILRTEEIDVFSLQKTF